MGMPIVIRFADGTERCRDCKGFGLVRGAGPRAGTHYKTIAGAQDSLARGNARDCRVCDGLGIVGVPSIADMLRNWPTDWEGEHGRAVALGVRKAVVSDAGESAGYLMRDRMGVGAITDEGPGF